MAEANDSGAVALRYFGTQMKLFRGRAGLSRSELGSRIGYSEATVASVEQGRRLPQQEFIEQTDEVLGARGMLRAGAPFLRQARYPSWFQDFALLEAEAVSLYSYETTVIPGLLQTEAYARAVLKTHVPPMSDETINERVDARLERQRLLTRDPLPVLGFVLEETALRRPIGGGEVLSAQLRHLLTCAQRRNIALQIMPTVREANAGLDGPLVVLETPERRLLVYVEGQSGSFVVSESVEVSSVAQRYGVLRAQALGEDESVELVEEVAGDL